MDEKEDCGDFARHPGPEELWGKISIEKSFYKEIKWNGRIYPGGFAGLIENRGHSGVHMFHGQWGQAPMASMRSPDDPLFYLHHAFIDYHWALWQDCNDYDEVASKTLKEGKIFQGFTGGWTAATELTSNLDDRLSYEFLTLTKEQSKKNTYVSGMKKRRPDKPYLTPRDMHDLAQWNIIYGII